MTEFAIRIDDLTRYFCPVRAVGHLTLDAPRGILFGFLGPDGAGKTSTIRLLPGLLEPTERRAEVLGFNSRKQADEIRSQTGVLLEHTGLYERLSAEDNLEFYKRIWHLYRTERASPDQGTPHASGIVGTTERRGWNMESA